MDWVDVVILIGVALAAVSGLRVGAASIVFGWTFFFFGLILGWLLGTALEHTIFHAFSGPFKFFMALVILVVPAVVLGGVGRLLGDRIGGVLRRFHLNPVNAAAGAALSVVAVLLFAWVIGTSLADSPYYSLNSGLQRSSILRALDRTLPNLPLGRFRALLEAEGFTPVFAGLAPLPDGSVPVASPTVVTALADRYQNSVVKVTGEACGQILEGTGFVVAPGLVVTNAHVVAGVNFPRIVDAYGIQRVQLVYFNPNLDVALLRAPYLPAPPMPIDYSSATPGSPAVFLGYPDNGPYDAQGAGILGEFRAVGPNIYYTGNYTRSVYQIEGDVRPGNSGGPLLDTSGRVIGVVFSRATDLPDVGYAIASPQLSGPIAQAESLSAPIIGTACTN